MGMESWHNIGRFRLIKIEMKNTTNADSIPAIRTVYDESNFKTKVTGISRDSEGNILVCGILTEETTNARRFGIAKIKSSDFSKQFAKTYDYKLNSK